MYKHLFLLSVVSTVCFAQTVSQTDWSGGGSEPGPVIDWGTKFNSFTDVDFAEGVLKLNYGILASPVKHTVDRSFDGAYSVYAADVDGDGDVDLLGAAYAADDIAWWENTDGAGTAWTKHMVDASFDGAIFVYAADMDGDGDIDVLGAAANANDITWWENTNGTGTSWTEHTIDGKFKGALSAYAADVDGDGDTDVLGTTAVLDDITWWENADGTGTSWTKHTIDENYEGSCSVYTADVDGDGDVDVLGAASVADDITWWENTSGNGSSWTEHTIDENFDAANSVCTADVDGDGDIDVLGAAALDYNVTWWENTNGTGTSWREHTIEDFFVGAISVYAIDIDGDGDIDVLGSAFVAGDIIWWENANGTGTSWIEHAVGGNFDEVSSIYAADVNGDGNVDVLGAVAGSNDVLWWNIMGYESQGILESSILDVNGIDSWKTFTSGYQKPANTTVAFQFRSSSNSANMGAWSGKVYSDSVSLSGVLEKSTRYLQYRVILDTSDVSCSPALEDVSFSYSLHTGVENSDVASWSLLFSKNPSFGYFSALVTVPEAGMVQLSLFDVFGRMVSDASLEFPAGTHSVDFMGLSEGVYFCVMNADDYSAVERVILLK